MIVTGGRSTVINNLGKEGVRRFPSRGAILRIAISLVLNPAIDLSNLINLRFSTTKKYASRVHHGRGNNIFPEIAFTLRGDSRDQRNALVSHKNWCDIAHLPEDSLSVREEIIGKWSEVSRDYAGNSVLTNSENLLSFSTW